MNFDFEGLNKHNLMNSLCKKLNKTVFSIDIYDHMIVFMSVDLISCP